MLHDKELFIFDMDGIIYKLNTPIPSAIETIQWLQTQGKHLAFFTNNSSKTPQEYQEKLHKFGIEALSSQFFTSGTITAQNLEKIHPKGNLYVIGMQGLREILGNHGFSIINETNPDIEKKEFLEPDDSVDAVVVGWDTEVTYSKLRTAMMLIVKGATFYATNDDASFPVPGTVWPGTGAMVSYLTTALGHPPVHIFGKPYNYGYQMILDYYRISSEKTIMIGDRLSTDILGANRMGISSVCIETGVHTRKDAYKFSEEFLPTAFYSNLLEFRNNV